MGAAYIRSHFSNVGAGGQQRLQQDKYVKLGRQVAFFCGLSVAKTIWRPGSVQTRRFFLVLLYVKIKNL